MIENPTIPVKRPKEGYSEPGVLTAIDNFRPPLGDFILTGQAALPARIEHADSSVRIEAIICVRR